MKPWIISFVLWFFFASPVQAGIVERVIYAGDTPLFSDCSLTQTGPMELTVTPCTFATTGQARIFSRIQSLPAQAGIGALASAVRQGRAEWMHGGQRIRGWLTDKQGNIIEKSATWRLPVTNVITVIPGETYFIYLIKKAGVTMEVALIARSVPKPIGYIHYLAFEFEVPLGTTDLNSIEIEVFTVRPDFPPAKGLFEK